MGDCIRLENVRLSSPMASPLTPARCSRTRTWAPAPLTIICPTFQSRAELTCTTGARIQVDIRSAGVKRNQFSGWSTRPRPSPPSWTWSVALTPSKSFYFFFSCLAIELSHFSRRLLGSVMMLGMMLGSAIGGRLGDRIGRKRCMFLGETKETFGN